MAKKKRKLSAYNLHMKREMKRGRTFKQAVASWKSSSSYRKPALRKRVGKMWKKHESKKRIVRRSTRRSKPMAKKKSPRRSFLSTSTLMKFARLGALAAPAIAIAMGGGDPQTKLKEGVKAYSGVDLDSKTWSIHSLAQGWLPFLGTSLVTYGISKLNGIIRRL